MIPSPQHKHRTQSKEFYLYSWMECKNQAFRKHLDEEQRYAEQQLLHSKNLQKQLRQEMLTYEQPEAVQFYQAQAK